MSEIEEIHECLKLGQSFLLSGGAGSGKTYTLVQTIALATELSPLENVACITFTNSAVEEIKARVSHPNLYVNTIHEFLWDRIGQYQFELRFAIDEISKAGEKKNFLHDGASFPLGYFVNNELEILYRDYKSLKNGIISHDELLSVAEKMFELFPKLHRLLNEKFRYIFVDEYQDTKVPVVNLLLSLPKNLAGINIVGFFGDSMQSIYDDGAGALGVYTSDQTRKIKEITKTENRRNPATVISLANLLRADFQQEPSKDETAPNIDSATGRVKVGKVRFFYSAGNNVERIRRLLGWNFDDAGNTKQLSLTHNLIAERAGYGQLMAIYDKDRISKYSKSIRDKLKESGVDMTTYEKTLFEAIHTTGIQPSKAEKIFIEANPLLYADALQRKFIDVSSYISKDQLIDDAVDEDLSGERDVLIRHLLNIERILSDYGQGHITDFLSRISFTIARGGDKKYVEKAVGDILSKKDPSIGEVMDLAHISNLYVRSEKVEEFITEKGYLYARVRGVSFHEVTSLASYIKGLTGYSTQHKTKGREFDNVLVVLDNGKWNKYNFVSLFTKVGTASVLSRTEKLFYVCCTRAREELAIYFPTATAEVIVAAKRIFGAEDIEEVEG